MNLVIDVGNTHTKLAWFDHGRLIDTVRVEENHSEMVRSVIFSKKASRAILSATGKPDKAIEETLVEANISLLILGHKTPLPVAISYETPETLGRDRIAAAAGARYVCPYCNVMIADMGTAITIDFVTSEGKFKGGNISPGMQMRFRALHEFTARLPLVSADPSFPEFGYDTRTALIAGVQQGIIHEINSYMDEFSRAYPACEFILTGGDSAFFVSKLKRSIFAIPDLVLKGLNYILEYNISGQQP
ncbi:MAG TPA: type III pantothenate kinase [Bacteroidales bacterium]|nr:type III pantothenate kinase [Bacteroidales bacterium]